ncbi:MAG: cbb3-type cytochrome c oxidase subunit 3 [Yoonia sp.]|jgi:cytochrome c oxidase cbb3-type subunit IV|uniref:cbb3-type cytochrome c oxidase subunit 3 n=1 Tax=Yoonia sp. TaxID=2212373 RepID=UPI00273DA5B9|nr:cbb3-type cytochrome c oxidase subunit 3 [Yoonia sp.]MDP5086274.1 cbb3-type cytochrome c oxidase subunit 3 [Yoonia sp.]MDP5359250.1 cbb3-type cytochrome c oxidase subunit 3 [Paracoccaceae bacterium]MDP5360824.1 cbb3-type cytochrome c oxidase subunit 3 [Paracoccaceae bacterium]
MQETSLLREIADNWMLVAMFTLFVGAIAWAFRPGSRSVHQDTANIPFRNEDHPGSSETEELQS